MAASKEPVHFSRDGVAQPVLPASSGGRTLQERSQRRSLAALERPAGKLLGCVIAALGALFSLALFIGGPELLPWYWEPNAPELSAMVGGIVISAGLLILYWRFTLRMLLGLLFLIAILGVFGQVRGRHSARIHATNILWTEILENLINQGLVETLIEREALNPSPPPLRAFEDHSYRLCLEYYPHADPRVQKIPQAVAAFVLKVEGLNASGAPRDLDNSREVKKHYRQQILGVKEPIPWEYRDEYEEAAEYWYATLAKRFGEENARAVMKKSATIVREPDFQNAFKMAAQPAEHRMDGGLE